MNKLKTVPILFLLSLIMLTKQNTYAQYVSKDYKDSVKKNITCLNKSNIIIEAYYGYPYLMGAIIKSFADSTNQATNFNHIGGRFEYLLTKNFGVGLEYTYALLDFKYQHNGYVYTASLSKKRFLGKVYYHFWNDESTDVYITGGIGSSMTRIASNEPKQPSTNETIFPVSIRLGIGFRHFFNETIGINGEVGIGGPLIQGGLSIKI